MGILLQLMRHAGSHYDLVAQTTSVSILKIAVDVGAGSGWARSWEANRESH